MRFRSLVESITIYRQLGVIVMSLMLTASCSKRTSETLNVLQRPTIQGEITEVSYDLAVDEVLAHADGLLASGKPSERDIDSDISKIETLLALIERMRFDKSHARGAPHTSTLGALYTRKAGSVATMPAAAGRY